MILTIGSILLVLFVSEIFLQALIRYFRKDFQWMITEKDENPDFREIPLKVTESDDNRSYHINSDKIKHILGFKAKKKH